MSVFPLFPHVVGWWNARNDRVVRVFPVFPLFPLKTNERDMNLKCSHGNGVIE